MKQRSLILVAMAMLPVAVAVAQTPPTPPAQPITPTPAAPVAGPVLPARPVTPTPYIGYAPLPGDAMIIDSDAIRRWADDAKWVGKLAADEARFAAQAALADARIHLDNLPHIMADAKIHLDNLPHVMADAKIHLDNLPKVSGQFAYAPTPMAQVAPGFEMFEGRRQQWQEPADSAYEAAMSLFSRYDYSRAAARFADMIAKYPNSRRVPQAAYYQAFALYRVGTLETLRSSLKVLEENEQRFSYAYNSSTRNLAPELQARVLRALIERKEPSAEGKLQTLIAKYPPSTHPDVACDKEKMGIQSQVLQSLNQADPDAAMVYVRQYLQTRDACNAQLRRSAVFLLRNRPSPENTAMLVQLVRSDTVRSVRSAAVEALSSMPGDDAINALQQLMQDNDEQIQNAAVRALMRNDNPRARSAMRSAIIDRRDAPERQRLEAIRSFDRDNTSAEDAAYLRGLFNRQGESDRVKEAILSVLGQLPNEENFKFLMDVAQNQNESSSVRAYALRRVTSRQNLTTDNLVRLYDATDNRNMRQSLVEALGQRPEQQAINKLLDIVKLSTDPTIRAEAIQILLRKKDPKITEQVLALIK